MINNNGDFNNEKIANIQRLLKATTKCLHEYRGIRLEQYNALVSSVKGADTEGVTLDKAVEIFNAFKNDLNGSKADAKNLSLYSDFFERMADVTRKWHEKECVHIEAYEVYVQKLEAQIDAQAAKEGVTLSKNRESDGSACA